MMTAGEIVRDILMGIVGLTAVTLVVDLVKHSWKNSWFNPARQSDQSRHSKNGG